MYVLRWFSLFWVLFFVDTCFAALTYIPADDISMTWANSEVFFDVKDDIINAGSSVIWPKLSTITQSFSWAFYLSGAGWIDLGATWYGVSLDCGLQPLDALTLPCELTGTGYGELIGEVYFRRNVLYNPGSWLLSWTAATFVWEYDFSGIILPLLPAVFDQGTGALAHDAVSLSISWGHLYGNGAWNIGFTPVTTMDKRNIAPNPAFNVDLSLASLYDVEITDPQGSKTLFEYTVKPNIPSFTLFVWSSYRSNFCGRFPLHAFCQDGAVQKSSEIQWLVWPKIANADDAYSVTLSFRDTYGNEVQEGDISLMYRDAIRTYQVNPLEYLHFDDYCLRNFDNFCALITGGSLLSNDDGTPEMSNIPVLGGISYTIASRAPTSIVDTLTLSWLVYQDTLGGEHDIIEPVLKVPVHFSPWHTTALTSSPITVGEVTEFVPNLVNTTPAVLPDALLGIYHIDIGSNTFASYTDYQWENIVCTKYIWASGTDVCDWVWSPDTSIISLWGSAFSWVYTPFMGQPPPENVSYRSYVRYVQGGTTVIYPSESASLGIASAGMEYMKILWQDATPFAWVWVDSAVAISQWNTIKKNVALKSRGRVPTTGYADVDYIVHTGSITVTQSDLDGPPQKRSIVVLWGDITLNTDIASGDDSTVLIALMDENGSGGEIIIWPLVRELSTSLFAEKSIHSSGDNQLYIYGNIFSHNTLSNLKCPYYVTWVCDPLLYNLENLRGEYLDLPSKVGHTSPATRASDYPNIPLVIEYDGRLMQNPPSILEK